MWLLQRMGEWLARPVFGRGAAMLVDAVIVIESFALALLFRFAGNVPPEFWGMFWPFAIFAALAFVLLLNGSGAYQNILRYRGIFQDVGAEALVVPRWTLRVASATIISAGALIIADFAAGKLLGLRPVPLSVVLTGAVLACVQLVAVRLLPRVFITS